MPKPSMETDIETERLAPPACGDPALSTELVPTSALDPEEHQLPDHELTLRIPARGHMTLAKGAPVIVRPGQEAILCRDGVTLVVLRTGEHSLGERTVLPRQKSRPGGGPGGTGVLEHVALVTVNKLPLRGLRWGTRHALPFPGRGSGDVQFRAHGLYGIQVNDSERLVTALEARGLRDTSATGEDLCRDLIAARVYRAVIDRLDQQSEISSDGFGELSRCLREPLTDELSRQGMSLLHFSIEAVVLSPVTSSALAAPGGAGQPVPRLVLRPLRSEQS